MIQFNLNIDLFYEFELTNDSEVKAIACIEYPILHIIAKTKETTEEDYDHLDRFIVDVAFKSKGIKIENLSELTGINTSVFWYRTKELVKQDYITVENEEIIIPNQLGLEFLNNIEFEREIAKTRSFLLDGVTHAPLKSYFYKEGKENLISDDEKDKYGNKIFNPAMIPNPPNKNLKNKIIEIPIDERANYNIPAGLKDITDFDFFIMTYPLTIVLSRTKDGRTKKRLIDCNGFYSDEDCVEHWQKDHESNIRKTEVFISQTEVNRDGKKNTLFQIQNNWGKPRTEISQRIFNIDWSKFQSFVSIQREYLNNYKAKNNLDFEIPWLYEFAVIQRENFIIDDFQIQVIVNEQLFQTKGANKRKIIESCIRKREYLKQNPKTGVWVLFLDITTGDQFVQDLIDLYQLLKTRITVKELLLKYENNFKTLRKRLIEIERYDYLEDLDIYLFLHSRETNFIQNYLIFKNDQNNFK